ncbi:hypothetical protein [Pseudoduganella sp. RAF53_2]|uniref:hypothetical protein n=1 Tax=unclassified Pseudoduganella TaxID=2637179 RepID=UPI003F982507
MAIDSETLNSLVKDYAKDMTSIRGRRVQRLVKREFGGADHIAIVDVGSNIPAVIGVSHNGAAFCVTNGTGKHATVIKWLHGAPDALASDFDLLKDSLPLLNARPVSMSELSPQVIAAISKMLEAHG